VYIQDVGFQSLINTGLSENISRERDEWNNQVVVRARSPGGVSFPSVGWDVIDAPGRPVSFNLFISCSTLRLYVTVSGGIVRLHGPLNHVQFPQVYWKHDARVSSSTELFSNFSSKAV
jgi:hypothetical protein